MVRTGSAAGGPTSYSTDFPLTENPISEAGVWLNSSSLWTKMRTKPGRCYGTQVGNNFDDSWAICNQITSANHEVEGVVYIDTSKTQATNHEVEVLLRWGEPSSTTIQGYECLWNLEGAIQIMRLHGPFIDGPEDYEQIGSGSELIPPSTGDIIRGRISGTTTVHIDLYINDVLLATADDTAGNRWLTGQPGLGAFMSGSGDPERFGFSSATARNI